jgi:hypothetical protein
MIINSDLQFCIYLIDFYKLQSKWMNLDMSVSTFHFSDLKLEVTIAKNVLPSWANYVPTLGGFGSPSGNIITSGNISPNPPSGGAINDILFRKLKASK